MQHYTVQDILALRPCQPTEDKPDAGYPEHRIRALFGDRQSVTLLDICDDSRLPVEDRQWVLHRLLPDQIVHEAACRYAERALERERARGREPDPRSWAAIEAKRRWLRGEISDDDLDAAESAAVAARFEVATWAAAARAASAAVKAVARDAAGAASSAAVSAFAWDAVWAAFSVFAWNVARAAEKRWQLNTLRDMIAKMEDRDSQRKGKPMKVVRKTRNAVTFDYLKTGNLFVWNGIVHMKVSEKKTPKAVVLSGSYEGEVVMFEEDVFVLPVVAELHVFDKE